MADYNERRLFAGNALSTFIASGRTDPPQELLQEALQVADLTIALLNEERERKDVEAFESLTKYIEYRTRKGI